MILFKYHTEFEQNQSSYLVAVTNKKKIANLMCGVWYFSKHGQEWERFIIFSF
jgi:hypothetical protein